MAAVRRFMCYFFIWITCVRCVTVITGSTDLASTTFEADMMRTTAQDISATQTVDSLSQEGETLSLTSPSVIVSSGGVASQTVTGQSVELASQTVTSQSVELASQTLTPATVSPSPTNTLPFVNPTLQTVILTTGNDIDEIPKTTEPFSTADITSIVTLPRSYIASYDSSTTEDTAESTNTLSFSTSLPLFIPDYSATATTESIETSVRMSPVEQSSISDESTTDNHVPSPLATFDMSTLSTETLDSSGSAPVVPTELPIESTYMSSALTLDSSSLVTSSGEPTIERSTISSDSGTSFSSIALPSMTTESSVSVTIPIGISVTQTHVSSGTIPLDSSVTEIPTISNTLSLDSSVTAVATSSFTKSIDSSVVEPPFSSISMPLGSSTTEIPTVSSTTLLDSSFTTIPSSSVTLFVTETPAVSQTTVPIPVPSHVSSSVTLEGSSADTPDSSVTVPPIATVSLQPTVTSAAPSVTSTTVTTPNVVLTTPEGQPEPSSSVGTNVAIAVCVILIVALAAAGGVFYYRRFYHAKRWSPGAVAFKKPWSFTNPSYHDDENLLIMPSLKRNAESMI